MFRQLLSVAHVLRDWKQAVVTFVHKKGPTNILTNDTVPYQSPVSPANCWKELLSRSTPS